MKLKRHTGDPLHWLWLMGAIILFYLVWPFFQPQSGVYWRTWGKKESPNLRMNFSSGEKKQFLTVFAGQQPDNTNPGKLAVKPLGTEKKIILLGRTRTKKPIQKNTDFTIGASPKLN